MSVRPLSPTEKVELQNLLTSLREANRCLIAELEFYPPSGKQEADARIHAEEAKIRVTVQRIKQIRGID
jgi:hypothetical protein